jgi:hypothetical protein
MHKKDLPSVAVQEMDRQLRKVIANHRDRPSNNTVSTDPLGFRTAEATDQIRKDARILLKIPGSVPSSLSAVCLVPRRPSGASLTGARAGPQ